MQRFQADPAYSAMQLEGARQLQQNSASQGLLESGSTQRDLLQQSQMFADQNYQRWLQQQGGVVTDYQNRLQQLAGLGNTFANPQTSQQVGGQLSGVTANAGNNISSLLSNQGMAGLGGRIPPIGIIGGLNPPPSCPPIIGDLPSIPPPIIGDCPPIAPIAGRGRKAQGRCAGPGAYL